MRKLYFISYTWNYDKESYFGRGIFPYHKKIKNNKDLRNLENKILNSNQGVFGNIKIINFVLL